MAKRKTKAEKEDEALAKNKEAVPQTRAVKKVIENPLRLNKHIILSDDKVFTIPGVLLNDEMFMTHIEYLISLEKLERV